MSCTLRDHHCWCIGVAADDLGHDRRVADPKFVNAADLQCWIDDRLVIDAHSACADGMERGFRRATHVGLKLCGGIDVSWKQFHCADTLERGCRDDLADPPQTSHDD